MLSNAGKSQIPYGMGNKILLKTTLFYIQAVQRCVNDHSFMRLIEFAISIMILSNEKIELDFLKENRMAEISKNKSVIEKLLEGCSIDMKNNAKLPNHHDSDSGTFGRNFSLLVSPSQK